MNANYSSPTVCELPLSQGKVALVDAEDWGLVFEFRWHAFLIHRSWYAAAGNIKGHPKRQYLHRLIMGNPAGLEVDHINGDGLDCRRENLRVARHGQNLANQRLSNANTSGYAGVTWDACKGVWVAQTKHQGKNVYLGSFKSKEEAARARDAGMHALHGEYARLNLPDEPILPSPFKFPRQSRANTSGFRGVSWDSRRSKWEAYCHASGKKYSLGVFADKEEAARARDAGMRALHGEYARLNFPD